MGFFVSKMNCPILYYIHTVGVMGHGSNSMFKPTPATVIGMNIPAMSMFLQILKSILTAILDTLMLLEITI